MQNRAAGPDPWTVSLQQWLASTIMPRPPLYYGYTGVSSCFLASKLFIDAFAFKVTALVPIRVADGKS